VGVDQAAGDADVDAEEIQPREDVVPADEHPEVAGEDVLEAPDDRGRERGVGARAEEDGEVQDRSHQRRECEVGDEAGVGPQRETRHALELARDHRDDRGHPDRAQEGIQVQDRHTALFVFLDVSLGRGAEYYDPIDARALGGKK